MNPYGIPEITPTELADRWAAREDLLLVDVREEKELAFANLGEGIIHMPLSELATHYLDAVPAEVSAAKDQEIIIFCHHGVRSAQVCAFLRGNGWQNVVNLQGGIDAYARSVDISVGIY